MAPALVATDSGSLSHRVSCRPEPVFDAGGSEHFCGLLGFATTHCGSRAADEPVEASEFGFGLLPKATFGF